MPSPDTTVEVEPSKAAIRKYIETVDRLSQFEVTHRVTRGWGPFNDTECPDHFVMQVHAWLKGKADA